MPLKGSKSEKFHELRHGDQFKKTMKKHGKKTAIKQMVAIILKDKGRKRKMRSRKGRGK